MPDVIFVLDDGVDAYRRDFTETLVHELRTQGMDLSVQAEQPAPNLERVVVVWEPLRDPGRYEDGPLNQALPRTAFLTAGLTEHDIKAHRRLLRRAGARFDLDPQSVFWMQSAGMPAQLLRPGHSEWRDRFDPEAERPVDVLFLGPHTQRTSALLRDCASVLREAIVEVHHTEPGATHLDRFNLLARAKIVLQLCPHEDSHFDWGAAVDAIHCGAVVLSERAPGISHLVPGTHILAASRGGLPYVLSRALDDPALLQRLRNAAHERLSAWFPLALSLGNFTRAVTDMSGRPDITDRSGEDDDWGDA